MSVPAEPSATNNDPQATADGFPRRILFADDPRDDRARMLAFVHRPGSEVVVVDGVAAALSHVEKERFDLILMGMQSSRADGYGATGRIRALEAEAGRPRVPIIGLTDEAGREQTARCFNAGCDAHIARPVDERTLLEAIRNCTDDVCIEPVPEISDLLPDYLAHRRADIDALWKALAVGNWPLVSRLGHDMKGSGKLYGLPRIPEIGSLLEASGKARDRREAELALSTLESFLVRVALRIGDSVAPSASPEINAPGFPSH